MTELNSQTKMAKSANQNMTISNLWWKLFIHMVVDRDIF